jgi:hypothetical protein
MRRKKIQPIILVALRDNIIEYIKSKVKNYVITAFNIENHAFNHHPVKRKRKIPIGI